MAPTNSWIFVSQIGSEAYITVNVASGTPQEAADWIEYMTTDQPTTLGKARAANGHKAPYRVKYLGIGNESWGCGGSHDPRRLCRAHEGRRPVRPRPRSGPEGPAGHAAGGGRPRRRQARIHRGRDEGLERAQLRLEHRGAVAAQLHQWRLAAEISGDRLWREGLRHAAEGDAWHGPADLQHLRHHGQVRPQEAGRPDGGRVGRMARADARHPIPAFSSSRTRCATASWRR